MIKTNLRKYLKIDKILNFCRDANDIKDALEDGSFYDNTHDTDRAN